MIVTERKLRLMIRQGILESFSESSSKASKSLGLEYLYALLQPIAVDMNNLDLPKIELPAHYAREEELASSEDELKDKGSEIRSLDDDDVDHDVYNIDIPIQDTSVTDDLSIVKESIDNHLGQNTSKLHNGNVGGIPIKIQIVEEDKARRKGLMFRQNMPKEEGMLFIHDGPELCGYYMKNTFIPLSIAYADDEGTIFQIEDMNPGDLTSVMSIQPALYALEMNKGWFDDNGIVIGNIIEF